MRPVIGVSINTKEGETELLVLKDIYLKAVEESGGACVLLPMIQDEDEAEAVMSRLDGLFLTGGCDVNPAMYGEAIKPSCGRVDDLRDRAEDLFVKQAMARKLPILAVCRGIQMLNVALGGTLHQDIYEDLPGIHRHSQDVPMTQTVHQDSIVPGTLLHSIIGNTVIDVNTSHHQAVKDVAPCLTVCAVSDDGITEGVYDAASPFVLGLQFHPERNTHQNEDSKKIFDAFVNACRK